MQERLCQLRNEEPDSRGPDREYRFKERIRILLNAYRELVGYSYTLDQCARL